MTVTMLRRWAIGIAGLHGQAAQLLPACSDPARPLRRLAATAADAECSRLTYAQVLDLIRANGAGIIGEPGLTVHEARCLVLYSGRREFGWDADGRVVTGVVDG